MSVKPKIQKLLGIEEPIEGRTRVSRDERVLACWPIEVGYFRVMIEHDSIPSHSRILQLYFSLSAFK